MEPYGRSQPRNGSQSGHSPSETGREESTWRMAQASGKAYPERPGAPECVYFTRTGSCGYGSRCRYNHPRNSAAVEVAVTAKGEYPERVGEPTCQFYLKTGTCKFGASCKFDHPKHAVGLLTQVPTNIDGYPLRLGEKECSYYLKTGQCKFGITCKFHHPHSAGSSLPASAPQFYQLVQSPSIPVPDQYGGASTSKGARHSMLPSSYMQGAYGTVVLPLGAVAISGWSPYSAPVSPVLSPGAQPPIGATSLYRVTQLSSSTPALTGPYLSLPYSAVPSSTTQKEQTFPERPGEPECQYYLRTGNCKFGYSCRYHHPQNRITPRSNYFLSPMGLPLHSGAQPCAFYVQHGECTFCSICKFDHPMAPMRYSPSASSLMDVPVAPYPIGSLLGSLVPASSSSELRPELIRGTKTDSYLNRMPPSGGTSSSPVGLIYSQTGSVPRSDLQLSGQTSLL